MTSRFLNIGIMLATWPLFWFDWPRFLTHSSIAVAGVGVVPWLHLGRGSNRLGFPPHTFIVVAKFPQHRDRLELLGQVCLVCPAGEYADKSIG
jgi:hypothetical protein